MSTPRVGIYKKWKAMTGVFGMGVYMWFSPDD